MDIPGNQKDGNQRNQFRQGLFLKELQAAHGQIAKEQGEHHVLFGKKHGVAIHQVEGNLGKEGQDKKAYAITRPVSRVFEADHQQEDKDGEGEPSEHHHELHQ